VEKQIEMHRSIPVNETSHVGQVRRAIQELAGAIDASEDIAARAALVATELCTNLVKHSETGGHILFAAPLQISGESLCIEILSIDKGRGIANLSRAFKDGYSTAGSPGTGLGAIQRMSDAMEIYSMEKLGTVISAQIRERTSLPKPPAQRIRSICLPLTGYEISGDYSLVIRVGEIVYLILSDGLGHGPEAAEASHLAAKVFRRNVTADLTEVIARIHDALTKTRGAAVAVASFHTITRKLKYIAVGNIDSRICSDHQSRGCVTLNGTAGLQMPRIVEFEYDIEPGSAIVMHTDGLSSRWNLRNYPGLSLQTPGVIAGLLYRDFARKRDDATVLVFST
jgi:anti-sigma regulatory factor (Ser/Thr protein kinase)